MKVSIMPEDINKEVQEVSKNDTLMSTPQVSSATKLSIHPPTPPKSALQEKSDQAKSDTRAKNEILKTVKKMKKER